MRKLTKISFKALSLLFIFFAVYVLVNSSLDIYNNFAFDKAILRESPYGYSPLLENPKDYGSSLVNLKSGDFVYVEEWLSAYNGRIVFAKVKSKLNSGYVNRDMLVEANINVKPIISVLLLGFMFGILAKKLYNKFTVKQFV
ncbi:MAG: hypothetical protein L0Y79_11340 [Chlorobi bacterium]|nr:hypothetical protein [Chlorobiota bacterium]MCI0716815.1 hypothetical protein [Chlorobiota bacterium]